MTDDALTALGERARDLDAEHAATDRRSAFVLPQGVIYLDGNSLGAMSVAARDAAADAVTRQWGEQLIRAWNDSAWWTAPERVGDRVAELIGAPLGTVVVGDSTTVSLYKAVHAAARLRPNRRVVLTDPDSFPTDVHVTRGVCDQLGLTLELVSPGDAVARLEGSNDVALASYSQVDYRTGELWDLAAITTAAHDAGALACWDLCHSAGVVEVGLTDGGADFAVGCGYKYLSGGPGAPAFLFVAPQHLGDFTNPILGWNGHATPFAMSPDHVPADGITRARVGTPPVLGIAALEGALTAYDGLKVADVRRRSLSLTGFFVECLDALGVDLPVVTPRDDARGSQVSLRHPDAYAVVQALIARGVIGDFREKDIVRLGFAPLYLSHADALAAAVHVRDVVVGREFEQEQFRSRATVT
ncbi:probable kyurenine hydrolase [Janibacter sp. HTCC2649]|uniref:kynureninase n=1 Tax=Janibacter sp. HTCC2649 TaxID=313589 RepID=UPI000066EA8A|nr:aminotransferase class V-fold PLP-dependent enzyme [Janibacter sp. HTCC2649]EAP98987.1 probable kyurenine hydrolase [Janibacter sp. HTCC2649]